MKTVAVLTPTYNRSYILGKLYQSLLRQTSSDFKWYIVDDGSNDDTELLYKSFVQEKFDIEYIKKENGGKHTALNVGVEKIEEELTIIVDSDDYLTEDAIETIVTDWNKFKKEDNICGISYYKIFEDGSVIGQEYPFEDIRIDTYINVRVNKKNLGDKAEVYLTKILKEHRFPEFRNERFLSEAIVWNAISRDNLKLAYIGKGICVCEYLEDGLSHMGRKMQLENPLGTLEHARSHLFKGVKLGVRMKYMLLYAATRCFSSLSVADAMKKLIEPKEKMRIEKIVMFLAMLLPGVLLAKYWKRKYSI